MHFLALCPTYPHLKHFTLFFASFLCFPIFFTFFIQLSFNLYFISLFWFFFETTAISFCSTIKLRKWCTGLVFSPTVFLSLKIHSFHVFFNHYATPKVLIKRSSTSRSLPILLCSLLFQAALLQRLSFHISSSVEIHCFFYLYFLATHFDLLFFYFLLFYNAFRKLLAIFIFVFPHSIYLSLFFQFLVFFHYQIPLYSGFFQTVEHCIPTTHYSVSTLALNILYWGLLVRIS